MTKAEEELGRALLSEPEDMLAWRESLGMSRRAMSEMLGVTVVTYRVWETTGMIRGWRNRAERVGRYYRLTQQQLEKLSETGVTMSELTPLADYAAKKGMTTEGAFMRYRRGEIDNVVDLGVMGLWVKNSSS